MSQQRTPSETSRLRAGLRRHGLGRRPADLSQALGRSGLRYTDGNALELHDCGRSAYPAMLEAIAGARDFVHGAGGNRARRRPNPTEDRGSS